MQDILESMRCRLDVLPDSASTVLSRYIRADLGFRVKSSCGKCILEVSTWAGDQNRTSSVGTRDIEVNQIG